MGINPFETFGGSINPFSGEFPIYSPFLNGAGLTAQNSPPLFSPFPSTSSLLSPFLQAFNGGFPGAGQSSEEFGILQILLQMMQLLISLMSSQLASQGIPQNVAGEGIFPIGINNYPYALVPTGQSARYI
jgi:hypothetical protein